jgi:hypothetical protein
MATPRSGSTPELVPDRELNDNYGFAAAGKAGLRRTADRGGTVSGADSPLTRPPTKGAS